MATNEPERFSMDLNDNRRDLFDRIEDSFQGNTKTESILKALRVSLDWKEKQEKVEKELEERRREWMI